MKPRSMVLVLLGVAACARQLPGDPPPARSFYFPVSIGASADGRYAYVVSSNFDLRYNAGWVSVVDLEQVTQTAAAAGGVVVNPREAIIQQVKLLSLAGGLAASPDSSVLVIPHRSEATLSLLEVSGDGRTLSCGEAKATAALSRTEEHTDCDRHHLLRLDPDSSFSEELYDADIADPFVATFTDLTATGERLLAIGHLVGGPRGGRLSVFDVVPAADGGLPTLTGRRSLRLGDANGLAAVAVHPDTSGAFLAGASKVYSSELSQRSLLFGIDLERSLREDTDVVVQHSVARPVGGYELSGLAFAPDGLTVFASNRAPDSVVVFDSSLQGFEQRNADGSLETVVRPRYQVLSAAAVPGRPTGLLYLPRAGGEDLLAVTSFDDDAVFLFAVAATELQLVGRLDDVGVGPYALGHAQAGGQELLLVAGFFDHTLSVIDVTGATPLDFQLLARLRSSETPAAEESR